MSLPSDNVWARLRTEGEATVGYVRLRVPSVRGLALYAARNLTSGAEALLADIETASLPGAEFPRCAGLTISALVLHPGRNGRTRLILELTDQRYADVFRSLSSDLISRLGEAGDERSGLSLLASRLSRWHAFLRDHGPEGLSLAGRRGLAGELAFLRDELIPRFGVGAVRSWTGAEAADHDFQLPMTHVEIKTTSANTPHSFRVSNVGQLDDRSVMALHVCISYVDEAEQAGESLPDLVHSLRAQVDGPILAAFEDGLVQAGYIAAHEPLYDTPRYTFRERRMLRVGAGFPRILREDLPPGVEEVNYSVAIAACTPFIVPIAQALATDLPAREY